MVHFKFLISSDNIKTHTESRLAARGYAWLDGTFLDEAGIAAVMGKCRTAEDFIDFIPRLNGCFSIVLETDSSIMLASDRFATYPLFYAVSGGSIYVSDRTSYIIRKSGFTDINENTVRDITYTGYPYLNETMINGVFQVIASELVIISKTDMSVSRRTYYKYKYNKDSIIRPEKATQSFDDVCRVLAERLVNSLDGRRCIVFLSGGADSRFCAYLLKIAGYEDKTILITYGTKLSPDFSPAFKTAKALGMKYLFIPYKRRDWKNTYKDPDSLDYLKYSQNLYISSHIREHFVIRELLDNGIINKDDVIIPGHLGTIAGRGYKYEEFKNITTTHTRLIQQTVLFYNMKKFKDGHEYLYDRTAPLFPDDTGETDPLYYLSVYNNAASCTYSIKYLINSLRAYDYYGLEWRLPLLDLDMLDFFNNLPFELVIRKKFFKDYLTSKIDVPYSDFSTNFIRKVFRNFLDARYAGINLKSIFTLKNKYNEELPGLTRAYRYIRNFSTYCSVYEIKMMKKEIAELTGKK